MNKAHLLSTSLLTAAAAAATATQAAAQVEVIQVTATKREESAQSIPVAVSAIDSSDLEELRVDNFDDYLLQLPGVTAGGSGPGQNTIYIRGVASTTPNLTVAGVAGLAPNVAFYLDEQPLAQPGRNLDVYAVDLERVEVLPGPQGTLFGASSQAGTVRLITNKPVMGEFEAFANAGFSFTENGEPSTSANFIINLPVTDRLAVRGVVYNDNQGGYIDNVRGRRDASESARFRSAGAPRANGVPVSPTRAGFQAGADLSDVTFLDATNAGLVEEDFNDTTYSGLRLSARYDVNADWTIDLSYARQTLDSEGVFFSDPELDEELAIQRYEEDELSDEFDNIAWTVTGQAGPLELVYTGAFTDRTTEQQVDYSDYLFVGQYLPYYICDTSVVYPSYTGNSAPTGVCQPPNLQVDSRTETEVFTQELRFNTPQENRLRATAGVFYSDLELAERNDFLYFGSVNVRGADGVTTGFVPNFNLTNGDATPGQVGNETVGYFSEAGPMPPGGIFRNDVLRTDEQLGVFGEATYDLIPNTLAVKFGARWYDIEVDLQGSANSSFFNLRSAIFGPNAGLDPSQASDAQLGGTNISAQFAADNTVGAPDAAATDGVIYKGTIEWTPTADLLFYATYSEGFRPGILNRPGGAAGPNGFTVPFALDTDDVNNYELGWKTLLFNGDLRLNGNAFFVDIENLQTTIFDPSITNLFFSDNAANAEVMGVEGDFTWAPADIPGLTVSGAFSILDTEITEVLTPTDDVVVGEELAFAPSFQGNLRTRYEWAAYNGYTAHVQGQVNTTTDSRSDIIEINAAEVEGFTTLALSTGLRSEQWRVEVFAENVTDERGEVTNNFVFDRERVTVIRPRTVGVRFGVEF